MPEPKKPSPNRDAIEALAEEWPLTRVILRFFVREGKAVKSGWFAVLILCGLSVWAAYEFGASKLEAEIGRIRDDERRETQLTTHRIHDLERELDDVKRERDKAQSDLAPWKTYADIHNKDAPPDQRLDLLLAEVKSLPAAISSQIQGSVDPANEHIASIRATADFFVENVATLSTSNYWSGALIQLGKGTSAMVVTTTNQFLVTTNQNGGAEIRAVCEMPSDSEITAQKVSTLYAAEFIQVNLPASILPVNSTIASGHVVLVINNKITLRFDIPRQKTQASSTDSVLVVPNLVEGLKPLKEFKLDK